MRVFGVPGNGIYNQETNQPTKNMNVENETPHPLKTLTGRPLVMVEKNHDPQDMFPRLKWLAKALSTDPTRLAINVAKCEVDGDRAVLVATDGRRLHKVETSMSGSISHLTNGTYSLKISARDILLVPESEDRMGEFPKWRQFIPEFPPSDAIRGCCTVKMGLAVSLVTATLNNGHGGEGTIVFNDKFLSEALGQGTLFGAGGSMTWGLKTTHSSPLVMTADDGNLMALVMPLRV